MTTAQVLLTQEDLADRDRALCLRTTLLRLLELGTLPILNENDSVSVRELVEHRQQDWAGLRPETAFGDNDGLSARVALALDADLLVLLTNVAGVYTANPAEDARAELLGELCGVDDELLTRARGGSGGGTGGMASKLEAARLVTEEGAPVLIASGDEPRVLERALAGDTLGTLIAPREQRPARLRRIALEGAAKGALTVNDGAARALAAGKASLLPIGVVAVAGEFLKGDVIEVRDGSGRVLGRGLCNYDAVACRALAGRHSDEIEALIGYRGYDALVTRDNLVLGSV